MRLLSSHHTIGHPGRTINRSVCDYGEPLTEHQVTQLLRKATSEEPLGLGTYERRRNTPDASHPKLSHAYGDDKDPGGAANLSIWL